MDRVLLQKENGIATITLDNTTHANCMTAHMMTMLCDIVRELDADRSVRCVLLTAAGNKAFCSGGDLNEELYNATTDRQQMHDFIRQGNDMIRHILFGRLPYVAAVKGYALGAAPAILSACDLVIASEDSLYGIPTPSLGGMPGWGSTQLVPRVIGRQQTLRMLLLNQKLTAEEALHAGLVTEILPAEKVVLRARAVASIICSFPESAMSAAHRSVNQSLDIALSAGLEQEINLLCATNTDPNFAEGMRAFLEKRRPYFHFTGEDHGTDSHSR